MLSILRLSHTHSYQLYAPPHKLTRGLNTMDDVLRRISHNDISLTELELTQAFCVVVGGREILHALERNTTVETLKVRNNSLNNGGSAPLAQMLDRNTTLMTLTFIHNNLTMTFVWPLQARSRGTPRLRH